MLDACLILIECISLTIVLKHVEALSCCNVLFSYLIIWITFYYFSCRLVGISIDSYVIFWSKYGLSRCTFLDRFISTYFICHLLVMETPPRLWLDAYHAPLIPMPQEFSWQCDLGRWRSLEPCFALCVKIIIIFNMQLCGFHCMKRYSICILGIIIS